MRAAPLAVLFFAGLASPAAADCPAFYRFVDFGITDDNGTLYRGGPVFRAEDFDGTPLLFTPATVCEDVADLLKDGRGNPIPVVSRITYDRRETDPALGWITVSAVPDASAKAAAFVALHAESLTLPGTVPFRGETFLCAQTGETEQSCQVVSPFATDAPLVVFCADAACTAPAIAMTDRLAITASWPRGGLAPQEEAANIAEKVGAIAEFLAPISSGL